MKFPRYITSYKDTVYIIDKGADLFDRDHLGKGSLLELKFDNNNKPKIKVILSKIKSPSGISIWTSPNQVPYAFITTLGKVIRVNLFNKTGKYLTVIKDIP